MRVISLVACVAASAALAQTIPIVPVPKASGRSNIEQRYVYAPPDKGSFTVDMQRGVGAPGEVLVAEPVMCQPDAKAGLKVKYDKSKNEVKLIADFHKSLPYRMAYTRPVDVSTPYNQFPVSITDARWQIWFVGRQFSFESTFYYSATTLQLLGNEEEFPGGPPPSSIPVKVPVIHMFGTPIFEGQPNGSGHIEFTFRYDMMLDDRGAGGTYAAFLPFNLCKPDAYGTWYLNGGLPAAKALNFDQVLDSIWQGYGIGFAMSLEPLVKPAYLNSRDNTMIGWGGAYPAELPKGVSFNTTGGFLEPATTCETRIAPSWPAAYFNICGQ